MDTQTAERVRLWLKTSRGDETQEALAEDITTKTGWTITRDRYSRYESGGIPIGSKVLGHFKDYWKGRGVDGPDLTPPPPVEPEPTLPAALMALAKELRESREDRVRMAARVRALESQVRALVARVGDAGSPGQSPHPETTG